jgi:hypothetical protein
MKLNWQTRNISVAGGLETKTHPKLVEPPKTTTADNVVYTTNGAARKRNGYAALARTKVASGTLISSGTDLGINGQELLLNDGTTLWSWSPQLAAWSSRGSVPATDVKVTTVGALGTAAPGNITSATIGNYVCVAYDSSATPAFLGGAGNMYVGIFDLSKGVWLFPPVAPIAAGSSAVGGRPCVVAFGGYFYVFFIYGNTSPAATSSQFYILNPATFLSSGLAFGSRTLLYNGTANVPDTTSSVDAQVTPDGTKLITATNINSTANIMGAHRFLTPGGSFTAPVLGLFSGTTSGTVTVAANNVNGIFCIPTKIQATTLSTFTTAGTAVALSFNTTYTKFVAPALDSNFNICLAGGAGITGTAFDARTSAESVGYVLGQITSGTTIAMGTYAQYPWGSAPAAIQPLSKPRPATASNVFQVYTSCLGEYSRTLQGTVALQQLSGVNTSPTTVIARALYDVPVFQQTSVSLPTTVSSPDSALGILAAQAPSRTELGPTTSLVRITAAAPTSTPITQTGVGAFLAGGYPQVYDGATLTPAGYDAFPELPPLLAQNTTSGALTRGATYFYSAVYLRTDAFGNRVMSAPAPVVTVVMGAGGNIVTLDYASLAGNVAMWPTYAGATLVIYRTTATDTLNFRELVTVSFPYQTVDAVTSFFDNLSDTALVAQSAAFPFLYAPPTGELPNDPPPAYTLIATTQNRTFVVSSEIPTRVYFSKPYTAGRPVEFNASSYVVVDPATGPVTALAVLDGNVIIFKASTIYLLSGNGPDATGNGTFNLPVRLASDYGCSNPTSILGTSDGVFYLGARGINLIDRALTINYAGAPMESFLAARTVASALYDPMANQARFFLDNGSVAVYDTFLKRWSSFSNYPGVVSTLLYNGLPAMLTSAGVVNQENTGFTDNGTPITMTIETGWIPVTESQQGWGRLRRVLVLGTYKSSHIATLSFAYDWSQTYTDAIQFSSAAGGLVGDTIEQWRTRTVRQVMQAVRLKLVDSSITGESYDIVGLALEQATKSGTAKLPDSKSV